MKNILFLQKNNDTNVVRSLTNDDGKIKINTFMEEFDKDEFLQNSNNKIEINSIEICNSLEESDKKIFHYLKEQNQKYIQITSVYIDKTNKKSIVSGIKHNSNGQYTDFSCPLNTLDIDIEDIKSLLSVVCEDIFVSTFGFRLFHDSERFTAQELAQEYIQHILQQNAEEFEAMYELEAIDSLNSIDNDDFDFDFDDENDNEQFELENQFNLHK